MRKVDSTTSPVDEFARLLANEPDAARRATLVKRAEVQAMSEASDEALSGPTPLTFDLDGEPPAPRWIVVDQVERRQVVVVSADTGAAKSIVVQHLAVQGVAGLSWLGHETRLDRVLYLDEENPRNTVMRRLKAMGLQADELGSKLRYYNRKGLAIGDGGQTDAWLEQECERFSPDLIIVDTLMAATAIAETNDNGQAVKMMGHLRSLAERFDCAVIVLHHERKRSKDHPNSSGQAMMGARQWAGQADAHMTLTVASPMDVQEFGPPLPADASAAELLADGRVSREAARRLRKTFRWLPAEKDREGEPNVPQLVSVTSEKDDDRRLLWMLVENEGELVSEQPTEEDALATQIGAFVQTQDGEVKRSDIAQGVSRDAEDITFKRALAAAVDHDYIEKGAKQGKYASGAAKVLDV
jgi:hypothetical protein